MYCIQTIHMIARFSASDVVNDGNNPSEQVENGGGNPQRPKTPLN